MGLLANVMKHINKAHAVTQQPAVSGRPVGPYNTGHNKVVLPPKSPTHGRTM